MSKRKKIVSITLVLAAIVSLTLGSAMVFSSASGVDIRGMVAVGERYLSEERYDEAVEILSKAIDVEPRYVPAYVDRAVAYTALGDNEKAIADYETAIELEPEWEEELRPDIEALKPAETVPATDNEANQNAVNSVTRVPTAATPSEDDLKSILKSNTDNDIAYENIADYDNDGKLEMFAFVKKNNAGVSTFGVDIYFVNENGATVLADAETKHGSSKGYSIENGNEEDTGGGNLIQVSVYCFFAVPSGLTYDDICYVWGVKDGKAYETNISRKYTRVFQSQPFDPIEGFKTIYDDQGIGSKKQFYRFDFDRINQSFSATEIDTP